LAILEGLGDDIEVSTGIGGSPDSSLVQNIWIEHNKCGMWLDGPFDSLLVTGVTVRNTFADGINIHKGITNTVIEQSILRNIGDDGLAMLTEVICSSLIRLAFLFWQIRSPYTVGKITVPPIICVTIRLILGTDLIP